MAAEGTCAGIEIGGTKLQLVLGNALGNISRRWRFNVAPALGATGLRARIEATIPELKAGGPLAAVGVGFGGPVNWRTGKICRSHQIEGWSEFDLRGWLEPMVEADVVVENDANTAALGEALHGAGKGSDPVFYITLGSGVGGGLVLDSKVYHGAIPGEAEIGHVRLDRSGTTVESRCSGWALDARVRRLAREDPRSLLGRLAGSDSSGEARHLVEALRQGDRQACNLLNEVSSDLAFGLSHCVHLFHPDVIVLGGGLSRLGEPLRAQVEERLSGFVMEAFPRPKVVLSILGEDAVPVGALRLAGARRRST